MNYKQALDFIHAVGSKGSCLGLERIAELMHRLGDPQKQLHFIHVAGSNGKGSVCAMLASILRSAGYRTGLYTSPHLFSVNERFQINGVAISNGELTKLAAQVKQAVDQMEDTPTEFECLTAMALLCFKQNACDVVVLEVGLGGRLDATNVIDAPDAAVITNIALEHTEILGDTLEQIAAEKAGILKASAPVVLYHQSQEVEQTIRQICRERNCPLQISEPSRGKIIQHGLGGQTVQYRDRDHLFLPLLGSFQFRNAAVALDTVDVLRRERGYVIPEEAIKRGLAEVSWPGRLEILMQRPLVLVDGAHNPDGVEQLTAALAEYLPGKKVTAVMGVMADKDYIRMLDQIAPFVSRFITVTPESPRALPSAELAQTISERLCLPAVDGGEVKHGVQLALKTSLPEDVVLIFGSLYQVGQVRTYLGNLM